MELLSHVFPFQSRESRLSVSPDVELLRSFSPFSQAKAVFQSVQCGAVESRFSFQSGESQGPKEEVTTASAW